VGGVGPGGGLPTPNATIYFYSLCYFARDSSYPINSILDIAECFMRENSAEFLGSQE
jgi:hypothetical protein